MPHHQVRPRNLLIVTSLALHLMASAAAAAPGAVLSGPPQPLDLSTYGAIRQEGYDHSHVMEFAGALMDGVGPRLTASPDLAKATRWVRDTLEAMGLTNAHLEDWGEFGTGWEQANAWARLTLPDLQPLWLQAAPWSAPTPGPITAPVAFIDPDSVKAEDLEKLRGTLKGKIVLLGGTRPTPLPAIAFSRRYSVIDLESIESAGEAKSNNTLHSSKGTVLKFLRTEGIFAIIEPSRDEESAGGTGLIVDDNFANIVNEPWSAAKASNIPHAVLTVEHYGRLARLIQHGVPVTMQLDIETRTSGDHQHGYNVLAEIPGTDPKLKAQVVLAGAHLDSWAAGTGATDDGAGVVVGMEAMRILKTIGVHPRRTIRLALWSGEEQGLYGSRGYVRDHLGVFAAAVHPIASRLPDWLRPHGALTTKPEWNTLDVYFNLDGGSGRIRGIYTQNNLADAAIFRSWMSPLADLGVTAISNSEAQGSDQEAFDAVGVPAFAFLQDPLDYETRAHHSNMDTLERLSETDLQQAAVVEATFLFQAAQRESQLPRKPFPHPELEETRARPINAFPGVHEEAR